MGNKKLRGILVQTLAYLSAISVAIIVGQKLSHLHPLWVIAGADAAATIVIFGFSLAVNNSSMYDPYWSVKPMVIPIYLAMLGMEEFGEISLRGYLIIGLSWFYGIRLTFNFLRGWPGLDHEDWRYANFRKQFPKLYWLVSFSGIHLFPTLMVYLGCLPMYPAIIEPVNAFGILDVLAAIITFAAVMIELVADEQMRNFAKTKKPGEIMTKGLWAYSRHPNYFGEIMFWWGLLLFGIAANPDFWWTGIGALAITIMFYTASIPMIDKRSLERRPGYAEHMKKTSAIIPWKKA